MVRVTDVKMIDDREFKNVAEKVELLYYYNDGTIFRINNPVWLNVSDSSMGGHAHRIIAREPDGYRAYYIAPGWRSISWTNEDRNNLEGLYLS